MCWRRYFLISIGLGIYQNTKRMAGALENNNTFAQIIAAIGQGWSLQIFTKYNDLPH